MKALPNYTTWTGEKLVIKYGDAVALLTVAPDDPGLKETVKAMKKELTNRLTKLTV